MKLSLLKKLLSWNCTKRNDVQTTFDDSYIPYNSKVDIILKHFVLVLIYEKPLVKTFFEFVESQEKIDMQLKFDHSNYLHNEQK